jgi:AcrR family transcriptional regulator
MRLRAMMAQSSEYGPVRHGGGEGTDGNVGTSGGGGRAADPVRHPGGRPRDAGIDDAILKAARERLIRDGYTGLSIGEVASDAGTGRSTLYRRWDSKLDLVIDVLDRGFRDQEAGLRFEIDGLAPKEAMAEAIRRTDPAFADADAMIVVSNLGGEAERNPELMLALRQHGALPRIAVFVGAVRRLQERGEIAENVDPETLAMMCAGAYMTSFYLGRPKEGLAERLVEELWPVLAPPQAQPGRGAR